jgi:shikimate dehydrogenase
MTLRLGLIGDNIAASQSPRLHRLAGAQSGLDVTYDRLVPVAIGQGFEEVLETAERDGLRGVNITYPYKERVVPLVQVNDPVLAAIGAVNTVIFDPAGRRGHNTDYTGFKAAYAQVRGTRDPGVVLMIGTGGVGRAVAFGLADLGARALRLVDRDPVKAEALAGDLSRVFPDLTIELARDAEVAAREADGLVNCTPVGMVRYEGTSLAANAMEGASWAFDAVYTPRDTRFLADAAGAGLAILSGWELFFYQGVHAWQHFAGRPLDEGALRAELLTPEDLA